uniref:Uncharacterized protein n=1 Tax=Anguilla anguilla TaxID=7936 RepID=A0A0E9TUA1_ANGAN
MERSHSGCQRGTVPTTTGPRGAEGLALLVAVTWIRVKIRLAEDLRGQIARLRKRSQY